MFKLRTPAGANPKATASACGIAALVAFAPMANAGQDVKIVDYDKAGLWTVERVNDKGAFLYCRAGLKFDNDIDVYMIGFRKGWMVQFFNKTWPNRDVTAFEGTLKVDGRTLPTPAKNWRANSVFINLGSDVSSMAPLMRGKVMSVVTTAGQSNFSLKGSSRAIKLTAKCRAEGLAEFKSQPSAQAPAASHGAFARPPQAKTTATAPQVQTTQKRYKFNYGQTLAHAKSYLAETPHSILPSDKNVFKHFPVNWKTKSGVVGGMMIVANTDQTVAGGIEMLAKDNKESCNGKAQVANTRRSRSPIGEMSMITTTCKLKAGLRIMTFSLVQTAPNTLTIIVEAYFQPNATGTAGRAKRKTVGA
jgi:hypothetical protein